MEPATVARATEPFELRSAVAGHFDRVASYWRQVYSDRGVQAEIYRDRWRAVLELVDGLKLATGAPVLDVGCGTGGLARDLAARGLRVEAVDSSRRMVDMASKTLEQEGLEGGAAVRQGSVYDLPYSDGWFHLTVAVGVLPWLDDPRSALVEMGRVTRPGGFVLVTADNRRRLNAWADPWLVPALQPLKRRLRSWAVAAGLAAPAPAVDARLDTPREVDGLLAGVGLAPVAMRTVGFGPFTIFRKPLLPRAFGLRLHRAQQRLADAGRMGLEQRGAHYLVLARRPPA